MEKNLIKKKKESVITNNPFVSIEYEKLIEEKRESLNKKIKDFGKTELGIMSSVITEKIKIAGIKEKSFPLTIGVITNSYVALTGLGAKKLLKDNKIQKKETEFVLFIKKVKNKKLKKKLLEFNNNFYYTKKNGYKLKETYELLMEKRRLEMVKAADNFQKKELSKLYGYQSSSLIAIMMGSKTLGGGIILTIGATAMASAGILGMDVGVLLKSKDYDLVDKDDIKLLNEVLGKDFKNKKLNETINKADSDLIVSIEYFKGIFKLNEEREEREEREEEREEDTEAEEEEKRESSASRKLRKKVIKSQKRMFYGF